MKELKTILEDGSSVCSDFDGSLRKARREYVGKYIYVGIIQYEFKKCVDVELVEKIILKDLQKVLTSN